MKFDSTGCAVWWMQSSFQLRHLGTLGKLFNIAEFQIPHLKMAIITATPFPSDFSISFFSTNSPSVNAENHHCFRLSLSPLFLMSAQSLNLLILSWPCLIFILVLLQFRPPSQLDFSLDSFYCKLLPLIFSLLI